MLYKCKSKYNAGYLLKIQQISTCYLGLGSEMANYLHLSLKAIGCRAV